MKKNKQRLNRLVPRAGGRAGAGCPKKSEVTRRRILDAAVRVFALYPYHAATIRMVAAKGGFGHGIIRYYFPSKGDLFRAVLDEVYDALYRMNVAALEETSRLSPRAGLVRYMDRLLAFEEERPEALRVLAQNMAVRDPTTVPGYERITRPLKEMQRTFEGLQPLQASAGEVRAFLASFNSLILFYLGASSCQAWILGLDPEGPEYRNWVREAMVTVFAPLLESMTPPRARQGRGPQRRKRGS